MTLKKYTLNNGWEVNSNFTRKELEIVLLGEFSIIKEEEIKQQMEKKT